MGPSEELPPPPADTKPARALATYSGSYTEDYYGPIRVDTNTTGLHVYLGHRTEPKVLISYDGNTVVDTETKTGVNFTVGSDGATTSVRFTQFDLPGRNGTFVRIIS